MDTARVARHQLGVNPYVKAGQVLLAPLHHLLHVLPKDAQQQRSNAADYKDDVERVWTVLTTVHMCPISWLTYALPVVVDALHTRATARTGRVRGRLGAAKGAMIRLHGGLGLLGCRAGAAL